MAPNTPYGTLGHKPEFTLDHDNWLRAHAQNRMLYDEYSQLRNTRRTNRANVNILLLSGLDEDIAGIVSLTSKTQRGLLAVLGIAALGVLTFASAGHMPRPSALISRRRRDSPTPHVRHPDPKRAGSILPSAQILTAYPTALAPYNAPSTRRARAEETSGCPEEHS